MAWSASDAEVSKVFEYGEGLSQSGGMLKARKRPAKGGVDREWPIFKWHSQLAFAGALNLLLDLGPDLVGRGFVAPKRARKTKAKEDTL